MEFILNEAKSQKALVFLTTEGTEKSLDAGSDTSFRKQARNNGLVVQVIKNTLIKIAFPELPKLQVLLLI